MTGSSRPCQNAAGSGGTSIKEEIMEIFLIAFARQNQPRAERVHQMGTVDWFSRRSVILGRNLTPACAISCEVNFSRPMTLSGKKLTAAVLILLAIQTALVAAMVHRESLTWDEGDHMFAGYMMWKTGDYGLNPEHPPLVKLLATVPTLHEKLWIPPLQGREFKAEAYLDGRDWLARNDGASQRLVFRMRLAAGLLAWGLALMVFFVARAWFGDVAALIALTLVVFDPNIMAHSALVTTDVGVSLFFLATIFAFYQWVTRPTLGRLLIAGLAAGLLAATKHSGILIAPMLLPVILYEIFRADRGKRMRATVRLCLGFAAMILIAIPVLWAFYGFRYAARPAGLTLSTSLANYAAPLSHFDSTVVMAVAHIHLLPESYLMGLVDVKRVAEIGRAHV